MSEATHLEDTCCGGPASNGAVQFGSNVSRLKSRFLQQMSDVAHPVQRCSPPPLTTAAPATTGAFLLDMSDHVEKFRHTRALFAQLAEQSAAPVRPPPLTRSLRSTSSASPPPTRGGHVRRSVSPSNDLHSQTQGQTRSCNGVTTWSQLGSRSLEEGSRSAVSSRSLEDGSRLQLCSRSFVETARSEVPSKLVAENSRSTSSWRGDPVDSSEVTGVVLRRNKRPNLDLTGGAGRAVLLPKRRSREEKTLMVSKDCLEASLCQADEYWRRQQMEDCSTGDVDPLMSESTFSSGSGEEMARSESGHDLAAALKDSTVSPTADSAEMWSRRLSAAMEAKNSEVESGRAKNNETDSCMGDCDHVSTRTSDVSVVVTSSRFAHCDLENTRCSASDCETLPGSATDRTDNNRTMSTVVDLSRTNEPPRSRSSVHCDFGGSATVSETVRVNAADYNHHVTVRSDSVPAVVNYSRSSDISRTSSDLENTARCQVCSTSDHVTADVDDIRTQPAASASHCSRSLCDLEGGSSTDCEVLEGSVTDCDCKDVDTEKSSTNCCETISPATSLITSSRIDVDDSEDGVGAVLRQETESSIVANTDVKLPEIHANSVGNDVCVDSQLQDSGKVDAVCLEQRDASCRLDRDISQIQESVVKEIPSLNGFHGTIEADRPLLEQHGHRESERGVLEHVHVYDVSTKPGLPSAAGVYLHQTESSDTVFIDHQQNGIGAARGAFVNGKYKMLSYRRETALQGALYFQK